MENAFKHKHPKNNPDIVYGIRAVKEAINSGRGINKVLVQKGLKGDLFKDFWSLMKSNNIVYQGVPVQKLNSITSKNHQGVIAFTAPVEYISLELLLLSVYEKGEQPFFLILDRITDVRNLGAIARTAECHGVHGIILPSRGSARCPHRRRIPPGSFGAEKASKRLPDSRSAQ